MTSEQAVERQAAHENLITTLADALEWSASALQVVAHELDAIRMNDGRGSKTIEQILDMADSALARAKGQQQ